MGVQRRVIPSKIAPSGRLATLTDTGSLFTLSVDSTLISIGVPTVASTDSAERTICGATISTKETSTGSSAGIESAGKSSANSARETALNVEVLVRRKDLY